MSFIYGIVAHPVGHSLSPVMHNGAFAYLKIDAKYLKFDVESKDLEKFIKQIKNEKISGLSVSIPHKENVIKFLDEISDDVRKIGACNTVLNKNGKLIGFNTDYLGFLEALNTKIKDLSHKKIMVFGAGGAARAICYGLKSQKADVFVTNIHFNKAKNLAKNFDIQAIKNEQIYNENFDVIINATPMGMAPKFTDLSVCEKRLFKKNQVVMDIVYKPLITRFLRYAKQKNCEIVTGEKMLLNQAAAQFQIWTGQKAPIEIMDSVLLQNL
ncbi:MAG: shikimate 5-dehydrogenase, shikimate dehydrogenase [Candidatus Peregrinibacteria bacterium GW2011_GWF2_33_10]|nr:MAG: shikimate 5-dehydrogenase, shikimate dehydrogenase [Candidatus Peregrinibacteria bacterium GW2011_GWF2_33_10]OGJ44016.1 MAG: shikimate dehydrogenase [Candidatus Peregrinibacteria bacterium RIFOXYA2_FULL_33_21]OGJ47179.1 MAG: shikimate dehydrogenase [Candidatus Peregrinibacteria bacterium RIFOXYA12_FULL_33_12]OGJ49913.1 MAG: shikimate dehydrogenase [Candidatus Peregrinibacteria bacterium RIFOXYB2_FULL_33_20]